MDYTDLISRLRIVPLHSGFGSTCHAAADALEARGKRIDELESRLIDKDDRIAELEAALREVLDHIDDPYNDLAIQIGELLNRAARAALEKKNEIHSV